MRGMPLLFATGIAFSMALGAPAFSECSTKVGARIELSAPALVAQKLSAAGDTKGEFETTAEFQARVATSHANATGQKIVVESTLDPENMRYDADGGRFELSQYAWANTSGSFDKLFPSGNEYGVPPVSLIDETHGLGLGVTEKVVGTYQASNSYGNSVEVSRIDRIRYGLFDRVAKKDEATWSFEYPANGSYLDNTYKHAGVFLTMDPATAKEIKPQLRVGVEFSPKKPFLANGTDYWEPRIDRPTEISETIQAFIGDIACAVITDGQGVVLKTVSVAY